MTQLASQRNTKGFCAGSATPFTSFCFIGCSIASLMLMISWFVPLFFALLSRLLLLLLLLLILLWIRPPFLFVIYRSWCVHLCLTVFPCHFLYTFYCGFVHCFIVASSTIFIVDLSLLFYLAFIRINALNYVWQWNSLAIFSYFIVDSSTDLLLLCPLFFFCGFFHCFIGNFSTNIVLNSYLQWVSPLFLLWI